MSNEGSVSTKTFFEESVVKFLDDARHADMLKDAISYLGFIDYVGNDKIFPVSESSNYLRNKARFLGIVNIEGIVSENTKDFLKDLVSNENNKFIIKHENSIDAAEIKTAFKNAHELAIHQQIFEFARKQGVDGENKAVAYLATLLVSDNFKDDIKKIIVNRDTVAKFNSDAFELKLTTEDGVVLPEVKKALGDFFSERNKSSAKREAIPVIQQVLGYVRAKLSQNQERGGGIGVF